MADHCQQTFITRVRPNRIERCLSHPGVLCVIAAAMTYLDALLLHVTESSCRRFQVLTGRTNIWLAAQLTNFSIVVYFLWVGLYFWSADLTVRVFVGLFFSALLSFLTQTIFKVPVEEYEQGAYRRLANGLANPRRLRDAVLRISFLILCVALCYPVLFAYRTLRVHLALLPYSLVVLTTVVLYLLACDPLPPCAASLKAWLRRFALSATGSRQGADVHSVRRPWVC